MEEVKKYQVKGKIIKGKDFNLEFKKVIFAKSLRHAYDVVLSTLGSNYKVKRKHIKIEEIIEINE